MQSHVTQHPTDLENHAVVPEDPHAKPKPRGGKAKSKLKLPKGEIKLSRKHKNVSLHILKYFWPWLKITNPVIHDKNVETLHVLKGTAHCTPLDEINKIYSKDTLRPLLKQFLEDNMTRIEAKTYCHIAFDKAETYIECFRDLLKKHFGST